MNIKIFCLWLCLFSSLALASENEPPLLWELTGSYSIPADNTNHSSLKPSSTGKITNSAGIPVSLNATAFSSLSINRKLRLTLPGEMLDITVTELHDTPQQKVWSFSLASDVSENLSPQGKLFVNEGNVSAWIPTRTGTWRVVDGVMQREMKWATVNNDHKVNPHSSSFQNYAPEVIDLGFSEPLLTPQSTFHFDEGTKSTLRTQQSIVSDDQETEGEDNDYQAQLKVLFVYTPEFAQGAGDVKETIEQWLEINNEIYKASGVELQLEAAEILEAELEDYTADEILDNLSRVDPGSNLRNIPDDILQSIWQERLSSEADIVSVLTHVRPDGLCGRSWVNGNSSQVFDYRFAINLVSANTQFASGNQQTCSLDTLGHEVGHNLGLAHSHAQEEEGEVFEYGRGYGIENEFATVMAYPQAFGDAVAVPFYSSPELECGDGFECGVDSDRSDGADAVKALNQVSRRVANIHNEAVTLPIEEALEELDEELVECIVEEQNNLVTNEEVTVMNCPGQDVESLEGVERFPRLSFLSVNNTEDVSLEYFKNLQEVVALDFRFTRIEDLRPIAHLRDQLEFLQFFSENMSCQDEMVAASWGIEEFRAHRGCLSRNDDEQDFDGDGINNLNDVDDDNDGIDDLSDALPFDDRNEGDIDADGVSDEDDAFPYDPDEYQDSDFDTIGDNRDEDDDNDGVEDSEDCAPLDPERGEDCEQDNGTGGNAGSVCEDDCPSPEVFVPYDYDGDGKADVAVRRASNATQYILNSSNADIQREILGRQQSDISVSGDFDGDRIADIAVRRPAEHIWYIKPSSEGWSTLWSIEFGLNENDIPVPADYDGDGITDVATRRPSTYQWFVLRSSDGEIGRYVFGRDQNDIPVPADYDGDGFADVAVRRPDNQIWYILNSSDNEISRINFGLQRDDIPVPADYDGDGITDVAVRRPSTQSWFILRSSDGEIMRIRFGLQSEDIPIVADYDGDGKADVAVRRPSIQMQYILRSSDLEIERIRFGLDPEDMPLAAPVSVRFSNSLIISGAPEFGARAADGTEFLGIDMLTLEQAEAMDVYRP